MTKEIPRPLARWAGVRENDYLISEENKKGSTSMSHMKSTKVGVLERIESDRTHHITGSFLPPTPQAFENGENSFLSHSPPSSRTFLYAPAKSILRFSSKSEGLWSDLKTMRWMRVPSSSFKMIILPVILYLNFRILQAWHLISADLPNPFEPLLFVSHRVPGSPDSDPKNQKGYLDLLFIGFYVIVWSFIRQSITLYVLHPMARYFGIKKPAKIDRFGEQGYALVYFSLMSGLGLVVMWQSKTWWYQTKHFWVEYPYWQMTPLMKTYYLLHSAYWLQQLFVLILGLERPRKDFTELVLHHIVTLWLIGWSYLINFTPIGNAVFISMDVSDVFLSLGKLCNYLQFQKITIFVLVWFVLVWTYFRHYLNLVILWSVWTEFDLVPEFSKQWSPKDGVWFPSWMRYQIFAPLAALQLVNLFWYFLIWRIIYRAVFQSKINDDRSDDEGEEHDEKEPPKDDHFKGNGTVRRARRSSEDL